MTLFCTPRETARRGPSRLYMAFTFDWASDWYCMYQSLIIYRFLYINVGVVDLNAKLALANLSW